MCGIAGYWSPGGLSADAGAVLRRMTGAIRHRGPDDEGYWCDGDVGIALGHRRLSIIDLSVEGHQPMRSQDGRYVIVYNGEVYNFPELRAEQVREGATFRGTSDTEVMLWAIQRHGLLEAVRSFTGMFAFALFDRAERALHLVRDRIGEKPLYYGWSGGTLLFGSELKALRQFPGWQSEIDRGALTTFLRYGFIPAPHSIYQGIHKVRPGTILTFRDGKQPDEVTYWSAREVAERGRAAPLNGSEAEQLEALHGLIVRAVRREMIADVPLGAFLSGGIDSSLVVALMQAQSSRPVRTFTIGFQEAAYNEARHAKAVASHLRTDHTELYVSPAEVLAVVPRLPALYDEPFADASQIPTFLVSQLARRDVTVSLSGDGGDELFSGYDRYSHVERLWRVVRVLPPAARRAVVRGLRALPPHAWDQGLRWVRPLTRALGVRVTGARLHRLAEVLTAGSPEMLHRDLLSHWRDPEAVVRDGIEPATIFADPPPREALGDVRSLMMYLDLVCYLPDDILAKVDRASMAVSLESRAPYLDHAVMELAWQLPPRMKVRQGQGKWALRRLLDRYVPRALIERPKQGFGAPIEHWLRGPLRDWTAALLDERRLREEGYFAPAAIRQRWVEHQRGLRDWHYHLWDVLMFQAWLETQRPSGAQVRPEVVSAVA